MSFAEKTGSPSEKGLQGLLCPRPYAACGSRLFNFPATINLYYNGLIDSPASRKPRPLRGIEARGGCGFLFSRMTRLIIFLMIFAAPGARAAGAPPLDRASAETGLADKDFHNRRKTVDELGQAPGAWKMDLLKRSLSDEDPVIRQKAARLIGRSKDGAAYGILAEALNSTDTVTRLGAMDGLRDLGDRRAAAPLAALLGSGDRNTRWKAAETLGALGSGSAVPALRKAAVSDKDVHVRMAAVESLGRIGTPAARTALNALKSGPDPEASLWAGNVLKTLKK